MRRENWGVKNEARKVRHEKSEAKKVVYKVEQRKSGVRKMGRET